MIIALMGLFACNNGGNDKQNGENADNEADSTILEESTELAETSNDIVNQSLKDSLGNVLEMAFDNAKDIVMIKYQGETAELKSQKPASGIWYKNDTYELSGKGNDIQLKKDSVLVFEHKDDIVNIETKNDKGDVLTLTFNNTEGTVKAYLNGGEQIDLKEEKSASGIWYKNENYELSGKGDNYKLTKDGKVIFEN